ncbi:restriction endonuclease subunit S [Parabacteroides distasonis]|uniref:restriction endonuclease subunit S n=1 Tax=Parabacteroides distasonis TaxID=823 RepID=UPI000EFFFEC8|nr:restriction endonuclease subunit S [Parabacteroides distasonis]RHD15697.1 restriction endonuclease subunit S [Parabacteroides distasonis]
MAIDNKEKEVLNVPPLRFPEFTGEWQCKAIEKVAPLQRGFDLPTQNLVEGIYPVIYSNGILQHHDKYKCEAPGLITGRSGTIGKFTYIDSGFYWPHNTSLWVTDFCGNCPKFIYYLYQTVHIEQFSTGSGVPTLNRNDVHRYKTSVPTAIVEQEKIAKFLSILDERIVTQNKIIEDLNKLKSAISECIFNSIKGDVVMLSEICDIVKGKQINGEYLSESGEYYVMNGGTEPSGYYSEYNVKANTISISEGGNSCGYVQFNNFPFWSGGHCYSLQNIADIVDNLYLYHYLKSKEEAIMKLRIGSGLPNIQKKDLAMFKTIVPLFEQQITISTFLSSLERKAEIEERILNVMQKQKLYLLQQMFI